MRLLLVGDMALLWEGIAQVLSTRSLAWSVTRLPSIAEAARRAPRSKPDVVMIQSRSPDGGAADAVRLLRRASDGVKVIILGIGDQNEEIFLAALEQGASGFIDSTASVDDLLACVRHVADGDTYIPHRLAVRLAGEYRARAARRHDGSGLSEREMEVLHLLAQGYSNKAMARQLVLSEHTVRAHLRNIMQKLRAENRVQAVARATREGLLSELTIPLGEERDRTLIA